jgi:hypothetical protein
MTAASRPQAAKSRPTAVVVASPLGGRPRASGALTNFGEVAEAIEAEFAAADAVSRRDLVLLRYAAEVALQAGDNDIRQALRGKGAPGMRDQLAGHKASSRVQPHEPCAGYRLLNAPGSIRSELAWPRPLMSGIRLRRRVNTAGLGARMSRVL